MGQADMGHASMLELDVLYRRLVEAGYTVHTCAVTPPGSPSGTTNDVEALVVWAAATRRTVALWCERRSDYGDRICYMLREGDGDPVPVAPASDVRCAVAAVGGWLGLPPRTLPLRLVEGTTAR